MIVLLIQGAVFADAAKLQPANIHIDVDQEDDAALFVVGNTLFAVYHELAHALIDLLELPVIGREEDAADGFAAVMMIPPTADPIRDELIIAVADGWRLQGKQADTSPLWGEHALDEQRYFSVICWMVGSDQDGFFDFAIEAGMPPRRIETCAADFERMKASWQDLLEAHLIDEAAPQQDGLGQIKVVFDQPSSRDSEPFDWVREGRAIERSVLAFGERIVLPAPITVRFRSCDDANAFWYGDRGEVLICYGLVDDFLAVLLGE